MMEYFHRQKNQIILINVVYIYIYKRKAELNSRQINLYFSIKYNMFGGVCFVPVMWKKAAEYILVIRAEVCVLKVLLIYKRRGR